MKRLTILAGLAAIPLASCALPGVDLPTSPPTPGPAVTTTTTEPFDPGDHWSPFDGCEYPLVRTVVGTCVMPKDDRADYAVSDCPPNADDYTAPECYPK
jgi:hypothetical protein